MHGLNVGWACRGEGRRQERGKLKSGSTRIHYNIGEGVASAVLGAEVRDREGHESNCGRSYVAWWAKRGTVGQCEEGDHGV